MRRFILLPLLALAINVFGQNSGITTASHSYSHLLDSLIAEQQQADRQLAQQGKQVTLNPYFYRLMTPGTLYSGSLGRTLGIDWTPMSGQGRSGYLRLTSGQGDIMDAIRATDQQLANMYVSHPELIVRTEEEIQREEKLREEVKQPVEADAKLTDKVIPVELGDDMTEPVEVEVRKPKFWKVTGNGSLQFTQSYFSDNWYQGGENNYAGIAMLTIDANYNNQRKIQWDNKLEAQLGFQTTSTDDYHKIRVTSNLLRLTSKLGYQATKRWFYTGQVMSYTQIAPYYEKNQRDWKANFATPLYLTISVGMDYKYKSKNGKVDLSVYLSPLAYYMTYVSDLHSKHHIDGLETNDYYYVYPNTYGMLEREDHFLHKFGPNLTINSKIQIMKNVTWTSRIYWFSNFHSTLFEWENTLDFTINKYLSAKFYAYPRFDDSSIKYRYRDDTRRYKAGYLMFKEWLSLGLSYSF
mgnify:CR=1 FL=1